VKTPAPGHGRTEARERSRSARPEGARGRGLRALAVLVCLGAPVPAVAQVVGNPPESSPYRDIVYHESVTLFGGHWAGNAADADVGSLPGTAFGGRLAVRLSGPVELWATLGEAVSSRHVIIADTSVTHTDSARRGPDIRMPLVLADLALALNVTGDKTWHRLAPYAAVGLGFVTPTRNVTDPGGYQVGFDFALVPTIGTRWFLSDALAVRFEVRDYYFRYQYPAAYFDSLDIHYAGPPPRASVLPVGNSNKSWTSNLTLWVGVAYGFSF